MRYHTSRSKLFSPFALFLGLTVVAGCTERPAPTAVPDGIAPSFDFMNGPATPGPYLVRYEGPTVFSFLVYVDFQRRLGALHGITLAQLVELCSGNPFSVETLHLQEIDSPEDANRIIQLAQGDDIATIVWNLADFGCGALLGGAEPVATGTVDLTNTDNDLRSDLNPESVNFNAWGFSARGELDDANGSTVKFHGHSRCVWDGVEAEKFFCSDKIVLVYQ
ncbi:MAG: hypothetical protein GWN99_15100 [Gemmatimonadetes bacterium]|uniref:Lipoprotein n=1 Tax=Candidatus Kutchimonas denitrificans TaxID=3056748 RepID=A0AAE4ZAJ4_9BACT|nr:hypothetical protein [Gemmatimonadota bacterium]NIR76354.1 hypothetical protein [Candidatus Kutchimonas denitrificans]NIS02375.1 hypothetical protein [Gemmatimonadota bacterium]NIT68197.1 hypothetical protein [Gemmatimonadota bacterium]NIU54426.1 hypothetical protein [Gemmatimonadota bacterium]